VSQVTVVGMKATTASTQWLAELQVSGVSKNTIALYRAHLGEALASISNSVGFPSGDLELEQITRDSVIAALTAYRARPDKRAGAKKERSGASVASFFSACRSFLNWCVTTEKLVANPAISIKPPKVPGRVPKALAVDACSRLLETARASSAPERDTLVVLLALTAGLRLSEIASLRPEDFSPSTAAPTHIKFKGKGDKERVVPVPQVLRDALTAYLPVRELRLEQAGLPCASLALSTATRNGSCALTADGLGQRFDTLVRTAGLKAPGIRVHMARHSFATHLLNSGSSDLIEVKELLGHASVATTQVYLKVDPVKLAAGVEANPLAHL
jgi:integrase/recombinase XerD